MSPFFSRLSYSFGNEDWLTEYKALQVKPDSRVVCITASGDRPLNLLTQDCQEIIAIDANPIQNYLLDLKATALKHLDDEAYSSFLGVSPSLGRKGTLRSLSPLLTVEAAKYWKERDRLIHDGVIYQGATEKWARHFSFLLRLVRSREIQTLFSMTDIDEQKAFLDKEWNHRLWKTGINLCLNRWFCKLFFKDPGVYAAYAGKSANPGEYFYQRLIDSLNHHLARHCALIALVFIGKVPTEALPPYLHVEHLDRIRKRLDRLSWKTTDIISYLNTVPENSIDRFSLSDVPSYLDYDHFLQLLKGIYRAAKPEARFCLRQLMTNYKLPEGLKPYFSRELALEEQLQREDRSFAYHFMVGKILK